MYFQVCTQKLYEGISNNTQLMCYVCKVSVITFYLSHIRAWMHMMASSLTSFILKMDFCQVGFLNSVSTFLNIKTHSNKTSCGKD